MQLFLIHFSNYLIPPTGSILFKVALGVAILMFFFGSEKEDK